MKDVKDMNLGELQIFVEMLNETIVEDRKEIKGLEGLLSKYENLSFENHNFGDLLGFCLIP
jgi:hypothetical protein